MTKKKTNKIFIISAAAAMAVMMFAVSRAAGAVEPLPLEAATPTIATTDKAVSQGDVVPGDVRTMEDYQDPFAGGEAPEYKFSAWRVVGSLAIVVLLIVGVVYLMRLMLSRGMRYDLKGRHIKVMDVVNLGANRGLYLISVGKRVVLIGSSDKGLSYLADVTDEDELGGAPGGFGGKGGVEFRETLKRSVDETEEPGADGGPEPGKTPEEFMEKLKEKLNKLDDENRGG